MNKKQEYIQKLNRVLSKYKPLSVYLYGSYAYGTPSDESDLDLFVITNTASKQFYKKAMNELWDFDVPIELVVYDKKEVEEKATWNNLVQTILAKGQLIYGQTII